MLKDGDSREIIFETGELDEISVCAKIAHTVADNKNYQTNTKFTFKIMTMK